jgi:hypothetical protein
MSIDNRQLTSGVLQEAATVVGRCYRTKDCADAMRFLELRLRDWRAAASWPDFANDRAYPDTGFSTRFKIEARA